MLLDPRLTRSARRLLPAAQKPTASPQPTSAHDLLPPDCALQEAVELPRYVVEHDGDLAKQPLLDYGIAADAAETPLPHLAGLRAGGT